MEKSNDLLDFIESYPEYKVFGSEYRIAKYVAATLKYKKARRATKWVWNPRDAGYFRNDSAWKKEMVKINPEITKKSQLEKFQFHLESVDIGKVAKISRFNLAAKHNSKDTFLVDSPIPEEEYDLEHETTQRSYFTPLGADKVLSEMNEIHMGDNTYRARQLTTTDLMEIAKLIPTPYANDARTKGRYLQKLLKLEPLGVLDTHTQEHIPEFEGKACYLFALETQEGIVPSMVCFDDDNMYICDYQENYALPVRFALDKIEQE